MSRLPAFLTLFITVAGAVIADEPEFTNEQIEFFESKVRPLLVRHCYDCHSTDAKVLKGGLYVDGREQILKGGDSGAAAIAGDPGKSLLIDAVNYKSYEMPPDAKLSGEEISVLDEWVKQGLPWPPVTTVDAAPQQESEIDWDQARESHWAWQPVKPVETEAVGSDAIDELIAAQRLTGGLKGSAPAPSHILARRLYLNLWGIPPTPEQVTAFVKADQKGRNTAVAALVDELLASPLYGQRWGRHWLDVARYSDGYGGFLDNSALNDAWRYRDWVVDALNQDIPYNEFVRLQIAGDLTGSRKDAVATGFFALGPTYRSDGGDPDSVAQAKGETLDDRIDTLTRGLLGITGSCARCHDHKFDPVPQRDYYSLAGIFNNSAIHSLPLADDAVVKKYNDHQNRIRDLDKQVREKKKQAKDDAAKEQVRQLEQELDALRKSLPPKFPTAHALRDSGNGDMKVALRGNLRIQGDVAPRRFLRILAGADPDRFQDGSGRKQLAEAIVDPANPLTARVFVNRVWMHHFGHALVRSPSNFGRLGQLPTHPELLDWLASDFIENGWSLKKLHRKILLSKTWQQSSEYREDSWNSDGDNRNVWRMTPRRMDVEAWRDSILAVTGELDTTADGPPVDNITGSRRRTLYAKVSRNGDVFASDRFLRRFDFPLMRATVSKRPNSIVPQQFLFLLNSPFMLERARAFVKRLHQMQPDDTARIRTAYQLLYSRLPSEDELQIGTDFLAGPADGELKPWEQYAQTLLSSNEFMYVR